MEPPSLPCPPGPPGPAELADPKADATTSADTAEAADTANTADNAWPPDAAAVATALAIGEGVVAARVVTEHRGAWDVVAADGERFFVRMSGTDRHEADDRRDLPVVGDVILVSPPIVGEEGGTRFVHSIQPRTSLLVRRAAGRAAVPQPIAANVELILIVTSVGPELRPARLERYLAGAERSGAEARIVLNKVDRIDRQGGLTTAQVEAALAPFEGRVAIARVSATTREGLETIATWCRDRTSVLVGSSGVGKSTLVNLLLGGERLPTAPTRRRDDEGRHTTRRREVMGLPGGGALVDTPGMREFGVWGDGESEDDAPRRGR